MTNQPGGARASASGDGAAVEGRQFGPTVATNCANFYSENKFVLDGARLAANKCPDKGPCVCIAAVAAGAPAPGAQLRDTDVVIVQLFVDAGKSDADKRKAYARLLDVAERINELAA